MMAARGRSKANQPEFWFCKSEACKHHLCDDPLFCTQIDLALNTYFQMRRNASKARPAHPGPETEKE